MHQKKKLIKETSGKENWGNEFIGKLSLDSPPVPSYRRGGDALIQFRFGSPIPGVLVRN